LGIKESPASADWQDARAPLPQPPEKILLVAPQPFYENRGTPIAVLMVLRALSELGIRVDLLTYPVGETIAIPGVSYLRVANPLGFKSVPVSFSARKVLLDMLLAVKLFRLLRRNEYRFIHAVEESAFLAVALRFLHRTPILYDMASSLPEQLALKWYFRPKPILALTRFLERWLLSRVDYVVASAGLRASGLRAATVPVREWVFPAQITVPNDAAAAALRSELAIPRDAKVVLYTGTFASYQGIDQLLACVPSVASAHPSAVFLLAGAQGVDEARDVLASVASPFDLNVRVLPRQDKERMPLFFALANVLVSPRRVGNNVPLKIFEYLAAGKPIVATDIAAHSAVLNQDIALLVRPNAQGLADGISRILGDAALARRLAGAARSYAEEKLSWKHFLSFVDEFAQHLATNGTRTERAEHRR
jgi:glycosyltransferase involved in cell wall biosynthesis